MSTVLFVVTGARHWTLSDGTEHPTGYWAEWDRKNLATRGGAAEQYKHPCLIGDQKTIDDLPKGRLVIA